MSAVPAPCKHTSEASRDWPSQQWGQTGSSSPLCISPAVLFSLVMTSLGEEYGLSSCW